MGAFQYLLQVNICLTLFYAFYALMLRNETFFRLNRTYLVSTALLSFVLPLLQSAWIRSLFVTEKVYQAKEAISYVLYPDAVATNAANTQSGDSSVSLFAVLSGLYLLGCLALSVRFLYQLYLLKRRPPGQGKESKAYSFFNKIVVAPDVEERSTIHKHEEVHVQEWHSADVLFFELVAIVNWFNPVVYAYKKAVKSIHEYIADEKAATLQPTKEAYAMLLMSNAFGVQANELSNSFYKSSLLKRRIVMLFKRKSRRIAVLKYGFSAPLFILMLIFSSATIKADKIASYGEELNETSLALPDFSSLRDDHKESYSDFLKRNPAVKRVTWTGLPVYINIHLKNGKAERYSLSDKNEVAKAIAKYGKLPLAPPPPPRPRVSTIKFPSLIKVPKENGKTALLADTSKKPIYVIDGKVIDEKVMRAIQPSAIQSVNVVKGAAASKYGTMGENGVVEIVLKDNQPANRNLNEVVITGYPKSDKGTAYFEVNTDVKIEAVAAKDIENSVPANVLIVIDGKIQSSSWKEIKQDIPAESIRSIHVLKDENAVKTYGEKGKNGVLLITTKKDADDNMIFTSVEVLPTFPGGDKGWQKFVQGYKYPPQAVEKGVSGRLVISFIVEKDGSLSNLKVVRDPGLGTAEAAIELFKRSPKWTPGIQNGRPVRVAYNQTIMVNVSTKP